MNYAIHLTGPVGEQAYEFHDGKLQFGMEGVTLMTKDWEALDFISYREIEFVNETSLDTATYYRSVTSGETEDATFIRRIYP